MNDLANYLPFAPTNEQAEVLQKMQYFLTDSNDVFILRGYAGTGKTSILKAMVEYLKETDRPFELWASTGRAAQVLKEKTGSATGTIHSGIYVLDEIKTKIDGNNRCLAFKLKSNFSDSSTIYLIDEASMIADKENNNEYLMFEDGRLLNHLFTFLDERKVVFIGDTAQLPPVNAKESAALDNEYLASVYQKSCLIVELTKVMRQAVGGVLNLATSIRTALDQEVLPPIRVETKGLNDIFTLRDNYALIDKYLLTQKLKGVFNSIYISLSNGAVNFINGIIRSKMFMETNPPLQKRELLIVVFNNYLHALSNGQHILVESCQEVKKPIYGNKFYKLEIIVPGESETRNVYVFKELLFSRQPFLNKEDENELMKGFAMNMDRLDIKKNTEEYIEHFKHDPFVNALRCRFGYCITCHKAQGGEWENVFLNIEPAFDHLNRENQYRWLYTAITRSSKNLYINETKYNQQSRNQIRYI